MLFLLHCLPSPLFVDVLCLVPFHAVRHVLSSFAIILMKRELVNLL